MMIFLSISYLNKKYHLLLRAILIFLSLFTLSFTAHASVSIEKVRIWPSPAKTRVVFDMTGKTVHNAFTLSSPDRLVIDLEQTKLKMPLPVSVKNSEILLQIRGNPSKTPGDARLVFQLKTKVTPTIFTLDPTPDRRYGYRLVIDLPHPPKEDRSPADKKTADSVKNKANTNSSTQGATIKSPLRLRDVVIAIDAGHGGEDPGAIGPKKTYEKRITLTVAKKLAAKIDAQQGMKAVLIRTGDYFIALPKRTEIARKNKADLLISIHADGFHQPKPSGASVFVLSTKRANTEIGRWLEKHEEQSELLGGGNVLSSADQDPYLSHTVLDLQFANSQKEAYGLAIRTIKEMSSMVKMHKRKPEYASLAVLKAPDIPSMLIELGFITNPKEEILLKQNAHQEKLATSMFKGVYGYFKQNPPDGTFFANNTREGSSQVMLVHIVRPGEYLGTIATKYGVSVTSIKQANNLSSDLVKVGQKLKVPARK